MRVKVKKRDVETRRDTAGPGDRSNDIHPRQVVPMASGFGLLALFSLLSILLGEDRRRSADPRDSVEFWAEGRIR